VFELRRLIFAFCGAVAALAAPLDRAAHADTITYDQILARPDDLALTLVFARQEIAAGRLEQGAASLERLLLLEPNWDAVRLYYAIVLYRLDDLAGAERELLILKHRPLSAAHKAEVDRYLARVQNGQKDLRLTGIFSVGAGIADNPAFASSSAFGLTGGLLAPITTKRDTDVSVRASAQLRAEHTLNNGRGDFVFAHLSGWLNEQFEVDQADYLTGSARAGGTFYLRDLAITPTGTYSAYVLDDDLYVQDYGGGLHAALTLSPMFSIFAKGTAVWQDFRSTSLSAVGGQRDGLLVTAGGGISFRPVEWNTFSAEAYYLNKDADNDAFSYEGARITLKDLLLLDLGQYLSTEFTLWFIDYEDPDLRVSPVIVRKDERYRARVAYGLPLSTAFSVFGTTLPDAVGSINFQVAGEYYAQDSNLPNFESDNWSGDVSFTKRVDF